MRRLRPNGRKVPINARVVTKPKKKKRKKRRKNLRKYIRKPQYIMDPLQRKVMLPTCIRRITAIKFRKLCEESGLDRNMLMEDMIIDFMDKWEG